jgi:hypothetical protein
MTTRAEVVGRAAAENGYKEGRGNNTKFGQWFGLNFNPWCGMYVSYVFWGANFRLPAIQTAKGYASVALAERWYRNMRLFGPVSKAQPGDIAIYTFSHTGIIAENHPREKFAMVWEGNTDKAGGRTGGQVMLKKRPYSQFKGVCLVQGFSAPSPAATLPNFSQWPGRYLTLTTPLTTGNDVKLLQLWFKNHGANLDVDGVFGQVTFDLVRWWQGALRQTADGVVGPSTWHALFG